MPHKNYTMTNENGHGYLSRQQTERKNSSVSNIGLHYVRKDMNREVKDGVRLPDGRTP